MKSGRSRPRDRKAQPVLLVSEFARLLQRERTRKLRIPIRSGPYSINRILRSWRPSFLSKYCQLVIAIECLQWFERAVLPRIDQRVKRAEALIECQSLLLAVLEGCQYMWSEVPWILPDSYSALIARHRLNAVKAPPAQDKRP